MHNETGLRQETGDSHSFDSFSGTHSAFAAKVTYATSTARYCPRQIPAAEESSRGSRKLKKITKERSCVERNLSFQRMENPFPCQTVYFEEEVFAMLRIISAAFVLSTLIVLAVPDKARAADNGPGWLGVVVARGELKKEIEATPILERPNRPFHFYGNTVRRQYYRGTAAPRPSDLAKGGAALVVKRKPSAQMQGQLNSAAESQAVSQ
jgi:hypothetical protein